ncbi:MAG: endonuclease/exonuclease/phosphatase family protein [Alphaproteobacteria bacterium]|nr:endonuclease/exonuclease/phosphatase family protein [Alphaproteobacteria bacterium]
MRLLRILFLAGIVGVAALTASAFLARWTQPFEILSHFRLYFAVAGAVLGLALLSAQQWRGATLAAAVFAANALAIGTSVTFAEQTSNEGGQTTRVIWSNLLRRHQSLDAIAALARSEGADIVTLTELPPGGIDAVRGAFPDFQCFIADNDTSSPTATLIASRAPCSGGAAPSSVRPYAAQYADIGIFRIAAVHGRPPWNNERTADRDNVNMAGADAVATHPHGVLVGDFNATPWSPMMVDLHRLGLHRASCGGPITRTWRSTGFPYYALPIDHVLSTSSVIVSACRVGPAIGSDHFPLIFEISQR